MKTFKSTNTNLPRSTAELSLTRALQFLRTVGTDSTIPQALIRVGASARQERSVMRNGASHAL